MVGVGIVIYYPDYNILEQSLKSFSKQNCKVLLVINGCVDNEKLRALCNKYSFELLWNVDNLGVAKAYNQIMEHFIRVGMKWVLLMDQDSLCDENYICSVLKYGYLEKAGILCPIIDYEGATKETKYDGHRKIDWCITSGSLVNIDCYKKTKGFDESFFIDWVDYDYCLTIKEIGYYVYQICSVSLKHSLGNLVQKSILGIKIRITNHDPSRKYFYIRNIIICGKKHKSISPLRTINTILKEYFKVIIFEKQKSPKFHNMNSGIVQGLRASISAERVG